MCGAALDASRRMQTSMEMSHCGTSCSLVEVVHVLSDDRQFGHVVGELGDCIVCPVRLGLDDFASTPFVPSPAKAWICAERFGCLSVPMQN